jgi:Phytanoyl-CoA dioxygenase (PhyH)
MTATTTTDGRTVASNALRRAPPGFAAKQWRKFDDEGILVIEDIFTDAEIGIWRAAVERVQNAQNIASAKFFTLRNFVEHDPAFTSLIDNAAYVGLVYDLYGEMLKLQLSELFVRPREEEAREERWHIDGPRLLPYSVFTADAPMQVKVGIWLTDVDHPDMGNLVFVPGSHRQQYLPNYSTHEAADGEKQLLVRRGSITLMNTSLWHRTAPNESDTARVNLYLGYCPSWLPTSDRNTSDPVWLASLNREQRIIMRSYADAYSHAKPPADDVPLFLDRDTGADSEPLHRSHVHLLHRKRTTAWERFRQCT